MRIVIRSKDDAHAFARLKVAGLRVETEDEDGNKIKREQQIERCLTPSLYCFDGDVVFCVDIRPDYVDKIPENDSPNFTVVWREDTLVDDGEGNMIPADWPSFEVQAYDVDGLPDGTTIQGAGRIV